MQRFRLNGMEVNKVVTSHICRACLKSSEKLYPLVGKIINVDVNIATMISYCISKELSLHEDLPDGVCIPCFKIIWIAYNFLLQFKESEEKLLKEQKYKQEEDIEEQLIKLECDDTEGEKQLNEEKHNITESVNEYEDNIDINEKNLIKYDLDTIHNYVERRDSRDIIDIHFEGVNQDSFNLQTVVDDLCKSETKEYSSSSIEYIVEEDTEKEDVDKVSEDIEDLANPPLLGEKFIIWDESVRESGSTENKPLTESELVEKYDPCGLSECDFTCPICNFTLQRLQKFKDHVVSHGTDTIICNKCPTPIELNIFQYIQHYKERHRYQCTICNRTLTSSYGTRYHMKQHENIRKYVCSAKNCKKSFFLLHLLKKHMRTHSDTIKYICNLCGAKFRTYDTYRYHQKKHDGKRHLCTECGKAFFQAVHLRDHMFRHTGYKHFTCDICGNSFRTNSQLKKHLNHCRKSKKKHIVCKSLLLE